jgi:hypothetical protein
LPEDGLVDGDGEVEPLSEVEDEGSLDEVSEVELPEVEA